MVWPTVDDHHLEEVDVSCVPPKQLLANSSTCYLDYLCKLNFHSQASSIRLSGIVCTIGNPNNDVEILERMLESGMNVARLNFSRGSNVDFDRTMKNLRTAVNNYSKRLGMVFPLAVALDTRGPKVETGHLVGGLTAEVQLLKGETIKLTTDKAFFKMGSTKTIYVDYDNINRVVKEGHTIYLDYGKICLTCTSIQGSVLTCTIENSGMLGSCKRVNLPDAVLDLPTISERDKEELMFAAEQDVDMVFVSYCRHASDIAEVRNVLGEEGSKIWVIAKIDCREGVTNIDDILKVADGILVGRGNLGIEVSQSKLFLAQKSIIAKCNKAGKPVICGHQLLESMVRNRRPLRAEVLDVSNVILDGADCVLLNSETIRGKYPIESVQMAAAVCKEAEAAIWRRQVFIDLVNTVTEPLDTLHTIAIAAVKASLESLAAAIVVFTDTGRSAFYLSKYRPRCPIIAVMENEQVARQANLFQGVVPLYYQNNNEADNGESQLNYGIRFGKWKGFIRSGDPVVVVSGSKEAAGYINMVRVVYVLKPSVEGDCSDIFELEDNKKSL